MIEVIVQSSTVGLFHSLGVAVAPMPRCVSNASAAPITDHSGHADFDGPGMRGTLVLSIPAGLYPILGLGPDFERRLDNIDLLRELTNQLIGRIKNRLVQFQVALRTSLPQIADRATLERRRARTGTLTFYPFRTIRGEIVVTVEGSIHESALVYSGNITVPNEGDIILF